MARICDVRVSAVIRSGLALLFLLSGCARQVQEKENAPEAETAESTDVTFCITADLHFTAKKEVSSVIIPMMEFNTEIAHTLADEVTDLHPDALIIAGDNTNSGSRSDAEALAEILRRIRDSGVRIVMVPGNHDFDQADAQQYRESYYDLFDISSEAPDSLSYLTEIQDVWLLAMDDSSSGGIPKYTDQTMKWLKDRLKEGKKLHKKMIVISHCSLLTPDENGRMSKYLVNNRDLRDLLLSNDVRLFLSGHQHSQTILKYGECSEIISMMPIMWPHYFGIMKIEGNSGEYHAESIDFAKYGEPYGLHEAEDADVMWYSGLADQLMKQKNYDEKTAEGVKNLMGRFFIYHSQAVLAEHCDEILNDPYYEYMEDTFAGTNYGPWADSLLHNPGLPGNHLSFTFPEQ